MSPMHHVHRDVYLCEGACRAVVTLEAFQGGKTVCGTEGCDRNGQPLTFGTQCDHCGVARTAQEQAEHHAQHHTA